LLPDLVDRLLDRPSGTDEELRDALRDAGERFVDERFELLELRFFDVIGSGSVSLPLVGQMRGRAVLKSGSVVS